MPKRLLVLRLMLLLVIFTGANNCVIEEAFGIETGATHQCPVDGTKEAHGRPCKAAVSLPSAAVSQSILDVAALPLSALLPRPVTVPSRAVDSRSRLTEPEPVSRGGRARSADVHILVHAPNAPPAAA